MNGYFQLAFLVIAIVFLSRLLGLAPVETGRPGIIDSPHVQFAPK